MKTHTDQLKTSESSNADKSSEEEIFEDKLKAQDDDADLCNAAEQYSIISGLIGDILEDATGKDKTPIDPIPSWFMNKMSGLEGLLEEAIKDDDDDSTLETSSGAEKKCDGFTCVECGQNKVFKEVMKKHLNQTHGHQISLQETPSLPDLKSGEAALKKKVELYEEVIKNLTNTKDKIIREKHIMKEDIDKEIRTLEDVRDKLYKKKM